MNRVLYLVDNDFIVQDFDSIVSGVNFQYNRKAPPSIPLLKEVLNDLYSSECEEEFIKKLEFFMAKEIAST
ncbi:MAG: hypothetical protein QNJ27_04810 [Simkaniaceae bacterium]|nr:hypothetical protein [Simkaniaceae bacterium]